MDLRNVITMSENLDDEKLKKILEEMAENYKGQNVVQLIELFSDSDIDEKEKAKFLLKATVTNLSSASTTTPLPKLIW